MSSIQIYNQPIIIPDQASSIIRTTRGRIPPRKNPPKPKTLEEALNPKDLPTSKLEPIDKTLLSLNLEVLNQYNDIVGDDVNLTFRSLPPVKVSIRSSSRNKFMESPRGETTSSRIVRPQVSLKAYSSGHHIFTEGISRNSETRNPAFALQKLKVPYSNLPENVAIFKEKNKFAFGVKSCDDRNLSSYKLTPKQHGIGTTYLNAPGDTKKTKHTKGKKKEPDIKSSNETSSATDLKSNTVKLEPIFKSNENLNVTRSKTNLTSHGASREPLAPSNTILTQDGPTKQTSRRGSTYERGESRLSIVSIGETVASTFLERQKQNTRKLYPMYDHKTKVKELYRRAKFGGTMSNVNDAYIKSKPTNSTFTYKVSTRRSIDYANNSNGTVSPIKNNLSQRPAYNEYMFRRTLQKRGYYTPRSAGSNSSTDVSQLPGNPPPSEISHMVSEDMGLHVNELRSEMMLTLHEERERTLTSLTKSAVQVMDRLEHEQSENKSVHGTENKIPHRDDLKRDEREKADNNDIVDDNANTDIQNEIAFPESSYINMIEGIDSVSNAELNQTEIPVNGLEVNEIINENETTDEVIRQETESKETPTDAIAEINGVSTEDTLTEDHYQTSENSVQQGQSNGSSKQFLAVPKVSIDDLAHQSLLPNMKEISSLSRSIQNLSILDTNQCKYETNDDFNEDITQDPDKTSVRIIDLKTSVPITRLRLFSDSTIVSVAAPSVDLTSEIGEQQRIYYANEMKRTESNNIERRLVSNANISFISPLKTDHKAKRQ